MSTQYRRTRSRTTESEHRMDRPGGEGVRGLRSSRAEADETAADELLLYIDNDEPLYRQKKAIAKNLERKIARGTYDPARAPAAWAYVVETGARKYGKEFMSGPKDWSRTFNVPTRQMTAKNLADRWYANAKAGRPDEV